MTAETTHLDPHLPGEGGGEVAGFGSPSGESGQTQMSDDLPNLVDATLAIGLSNNGARGSDGEEPVGQPSSLVSERISAQLPQALSRVMSVIEVGRVDRRTTPFLTEFSPHHARQVAQRMPGMRDRLSRSTLGLGDALLLTVMHSTPDLLESPEARHIPGFIASWLETDEGRVAADAAGRQTIDTNKIRTKTMHIRRMSERP